MQIIYIHTCYAACNTSIALLIGWCMLARGHGVVCGDGDGWFSSLVEEIAMDFDRETMPGWMALPDPATLPDLPFEIDYVRSWRHVI